MSYVLRRSGRKLGTARDARIAHAMAVAAKEAVQDAEREYWRIADRWSGLPEDCPEFDLTEAYGPFLMEGWTVLGRGAYRVTFLSPKGVVYKVNRGFVDGYEGNGQEMISIFRVKEDGIPEGWAVPDATLYTIPGTARAGYGDDTVIAMPVVDTSAPLHECYGTFSHSKCKCHDSAGNRRLSSRGEVCTYRVFNYGRRVFSDLHAGNVFPAEDGTLWVLDITSK